MGPLLLTGLSVFGALLAIGLVVASSTAPASGGALTPARRLALIVIALATGCGVVGIVAGLLAITAGARLEPGSTRLLLTLTAAGCLVAPFVVLRAPGPVDRWVLARAAGLGGGLALLAVVVGILSLVIHQFVSGSTPPWAYLVLGLIGAGGIIGVGIAGARSIREVGRLDEEPARAATSKAIARILPFEAIGYGASLVAIVLIVTR